MSTRNRTRKKKRVDMESSKRRLQNAFAEKTSEVKARCERQLRDAVDHSALRILSIIRSKAEDLNVDKLDLVKRVVSLV